jgi:hypothetical protein
MTMRGILVEYAASFPPLVLSFEFNPKTISRTRSIKVKSGDLPANRGGYSFTTPRQTPRAAQGVTVDPETLSIIILLDATTRMNDGDDIAAHLGVQPEIDTLRSMVEPKIQGPGGVQILSSLGALGGRAVSSRESPSVILFVWGISILPVFLTSVKVDEKEYLPTLMPYRAEATLTMQVIESANPFYDAEKVRQFLGAGTHAINEVLSPIMGLF